MCGGSFHLNQNWWDGAKSIKWHCYRAYQSVTLSPLGAEALLPVPSCFCMAVVYCCIHFNHAWGESCRTRLWEICVGKSDLVSSGPGVSERPLFVEPYWTRASWGWGTFCARLDGKVRNDRSSVKLMWHHCAHPFDQVAQLSRRKWG